MADLPHGIPWYREYRWARRPSIRTSLILTAPALDRPRISYRDFTGRPSKTRNFYVTRFPLSRRNLLRSHNYTPPFDSVPFERKFDATIPSLLLLNPLSLFKIQLSCFDRSLRTTSRFTFTRNPDRTFIGSTLNREWVPNLLVNTRPRAAGLNGFVYNLENGDTSDRILRTYRSKFRSSEI